MVYSSQVLPAGLPESSGHEDHGTSTSSSHGPGNQTAVPEDSVLVSAGDGPVGASSPPLTGSLCHQPEVPQLPEYKSMGQETPPKQSLVADQKLPVLPGRATRSSQSPKKPFNSIIEHLSVVFPCYNRYGYKVPVTLLNTSLN